MRESLLAEHFLQKSYWTRTDTDIHTHTHANSHTQFYKYFAGKRILLV